MSLLPNTPHHGRSSGQHVSWLPYLLLIGAVLLVYAQITTFSFVNWDDPRYVYRNPVLLYPERYTWWQRWFPEYFGYPLPLTLLSYRIDQWIFGVPAPNQLDMSLGWGYHVTNLVLWIIIVTLVYRLCFTLSRSDWAAFAGAMVFAFHPTAAETVAWATGRKELLLAVWSLLCLLGIFRYNQRPSGQLALWIGVCALAALLSKPNAIFLLPLGAWLLAFTSGATSLVSSSTADSPDIARFRGYWFPIIVVGLVFGVMCLISVWLGMQWQQNLGAIESSRSWLSVLDRALWALGYHARLFWFPVGLRVKYIEEPSGFGMYHLLGLGTLAGLLFFAFHPRTRRTIAGWGSMVWLTAYLPVSNLMPLSRFLADTYLFVPMIGVSLLFASLMQRLAQIQSWVIRQSIYVVLVCGGIVLMILTYHQVRVWRDAPSLWEHTYRYHADNPKVCRMLGFAYNETNQLRKAAKVYEGCIRQFGPALYQNNLAITYVLLREWHKAKVLFEQILRQRPYDQRANFYLRVIEQELKLFQNKGKMRITP